MGANVYYYFTPYQQNIETALQALREQEFRAGRYDPAMQRADPPLYMFEFQFPPDETSPAPGPVHATLDEAIFNDEMDANGTRSIIDLFRVTDEPDFCAVNPVAKEDLIALFSTAEPSREHILKTLFDRQPNPIVERFHHSIERGQGRYIIAFAEGAPKEIFFIGYSFD